MSTKDLLNLGGILVKKSLKEYITPHKMSVVLLIQEFCHIRSTGKSYLRLLKAFGA